MSLVAGQMAAVQWQQQSPVSSQQVPEIMTFIHRHLKSSSTSVQLILLSVLDALAYQFPRDVLTSVLIYLPQNDRYQP